MIQFRAATPTDEVGVARVVHEVWGQRILPAVYQVQVTGRDSALWVAVERGQVLGFVSAFPTVDRQGERRWEVDLLAVMPAHQGQGLGRQLVARICQAPQAQTAALARAAIRVENIASQRAFENVGFVTDRREHDLLLWTPQPGPDAESTAPIALLPVDTLTYRGLWIEGLTDEGVSPEQQRRAVRVARARAAREGRLNVGAVLPALPLDAELRSQANRHGAYYWYAQPIIHPPTG